MLRWCVSALAACGSSARVAAPRGTAAASANVATCEVATPHGEHSKFVYLADLAQHGERSYVLGELADRLAVASLGARGELHVDRLPEATPDRIAFYRFALRSDGVSVLTQDNLSGPTPPTRTAKLVDVDIDAVSGRVTSRERVLPDAGDVYDVAVGPSRLLAVGQGSGTYELRVWDRQSLRLVAMATMRRGSISLDAECDGDDCFGHDPRSGATYRVIAGSTTPVIGQTVATADSIGAMFPDQASASVDQRWLEPKLFAVGERRFVAYQTIHGAWLALVAGQGHLVAPVTLGSTRARTVALARGRDGVLISSYEPARPIDVPTDDQALGSMRFIPNAGMPGPELDVIHFHPYTGTWSLPMVAPGYFAAFETGDGSSDLVVLRAPCE